MSKKPLFSAWLVAAVATLTLGVRADAPHIYAIQGARLVTAAGAPIASGTIVIKNGLIESIGADVQAPTEAIVIEGAGLSVYPGLIDMGTSTGIETTGPTPPASFRTTEEAERFRRNVILRPDLEIAGYVRPDAPELARFASSGVTSVLATPAGGVVKGQSALINVTAGPDEPQIGAVADPRRGLQVVRSPVALHVDFGGRGGGGGYPVSLMGAIAFVRQSFLDAQHHLLAKQRYERVKTGVTRPIHDPTLDALQPALTGRLPVAFEADAAREIVRALNMAKEFKLDPIVTSAREADQVAAELKAQSARVIYSLNFPVRSRTLAPDADEPVRQLRARAQAPKVPAALDKAGLTFAFSSAGIREPRDFVRNAARAVREGLPADSAVRALTINAAKIAGAAERIGSLEKGKIANIVVTEGDLFDDKMRVRHVFVDGRSVTVEEPPQGRSRSEQ